MRGDGKVAIVTGASTGIGQASAKALHQAGFRVFGTSRRAVANTLEGITMVTCDVTDDASVKAAFDMVLGRTGRIDVLVYNAGMGLLGGAEESSIDQAQALFNVNLYGVILTPNAIDERFGIEEGSFVSIEAHKGGILIRPTRRGRAC